MIGLRRFGLCQERLPPDEIVLLLADEVIEPRIKCRVFDTEIRTPGAITLFKPHRVQSVRAELHHALVRALGHDGFVDVDKIGTAHMQFPASSPT